MKTIFQVLDTVARVGVAAGLLLIGHEMHTANGPGAASAAAPRPTGYVQTAATEAAEKKPATMSTIDADLREINYTLSNVNVSINQLGMTLSTPHR